MFDPIDTTDAIEQAILAPSATILALRAQQAVKAIRLEERNLSSLLEGDTLVTFDRALPKLRGNSGQANRHLYHHRRFMPLEQAPERTTRPMHAPQPLPRYQAPPCISDAWETACEAWLASHTYRLDMGRRIKALAGVKHSLAWRKEDRRTRGVRFLETVTSHRRFGTV